ncbi:MAG: RNA polymerase sigma factor [Blastocatellales bacterium]
MMERRAVMNEMASERLLIEACRSGDREAFRRLYELHKDRVYSIALHFSGNDASARDIVQQVFLKLFTKIGEFRSESIFSTWLHRITVNACLDEHRKQRRFISIDDQGGEEEGDENPFIESRVTIETDYSMIERSALVRRAVGRLKPKLRIAILLKYFEDLSYREMAEALGCSEGTVASRLNRGHRELAGLLEALRGDIK